MKRRKHWLPNWLYDWWYCRDVQGTEPMTSLLAGQYYLHIETGRRFKPSISAQMSRDGLEALWEDIGNLLSTTAPNGDGTYRWFIDEEAP